MASQLYKISDTESRFISRKVWVETGYFEPDPPEPPDPRIPDDPVDEGPIPEYGIIGYPGRWGLILPGMRLYCEFIAQDEFPPYTKHYAVYYGY